MAKSRDGLQICRFTLEVRVSPSLLGPGHQTNQPRCTERTRSEAYPHPQVMELTRPRIRQRALATQLTRACNT